MNAGRWLQVVGGGFEFLGLVTVAVGIADTRRAFTDRPSLVGRLMMFVRRVVARLRRRPHNVFATDAALETDSALNARGKLTLVPQEGLSVEERLERFRQVLNRHEELLDDLAERIDREVGDRKAGDEREQRGRDQVRQALERQIQEAAAGGLKLESLGVVFFGLGLALSIAGNIVT